MVGRVLLFAVALTVGAIVDDACAQAPPVPATKANGLIAPQIAVEKREMRRQQRAANKAARGAIRKKRVQCFDEAKKRSLTGQKQIEFVQACTDKRD